jgi:hypothetical protein
VTLWFPLTARSARFPGGIQKGQQQVLRAGEIVLEAVSFLLGLVENLRHLGGHGELGSIAVYLRLPREGLSDGAGKLPRVHANALEQRRHHAVLLLQQGEQEVLGIQGRVVERVRKGVRFLQGFLRLQGQFVISHVVLRKDVLHVR